jgi:hypothetical protein
MPLSQAELCRQKTIECEEEAKRMPSSLDARRGSNLPNNGVRWPTGLKDTPTDRFRSARLQSPNRRMPCTQKCIWHDRVDLFAARLVFFPSRALPYMPSFLFICPRTGMYAQGWTDAHGPKNDSTYENTTCNACHRLHLINSKTGRMLGGNFQGRHCRKEICPHRRLLFGSQSGL